MDAWKAAFRELLRVPVSDSFRGARRLRYLNSDGKLHNLYGPAEIICTSSGILYSLSWYVDGKRHRHILSRYRYGNDIDTCAYVRYYPDGSICQVAFFNEGLVHNDNGPAEITYIFGKMSSRLYYENGVHIPKYGIYTPGFALKL